MEEGIHMSGVKSGLSRAVPHTVTGAVSVRAELRDRPISVEVTGLGDGFPASIGGAFLQRLKLACQSSCDTPQLTLALRRDLPVRRQGIFQNRGLSILCSLGNGGSHRVADLVESAIEDFRYRLFADVDLKYGL